MGLYFHTFLATLLAFSLSHVAAEPSKGMLLARGSTTPCSDYGYKTCGQGCIPLSWTCCPNHAGGCRPTQYCFLGSNNEYGCCNLGDHCSGAAAATTSYFTSTEKQTQTYVYTHTHSHTQTRTLLPPVVTHPANMTTPPVIPPPTMTIAPNMTNTTMPVPPPYTNVASTSSNYSFIAGLFGTIFAAFLAL